MTLVFPHSLPIELGVERCDHFDVVLSDPGSQLGIWDGPLLLHAVQLLQLCVESLQGREGGREGKCTYMYM